ncbi:uncharacterized protein LOC112557168 [Pomacea canaliculata]|uniref:uncharacterized protein LOC112557168 n=1 Tax=Pomacea canaliculata TaxID=400727 RepID=UPI000D739523|nr:uncharacterized protein LOC112557168 [Pomacea canaliculata]
MLLRVSHFSQWHSLAMVGIILFLDLPSTRGQGRLQLPFARSSVWRSGLDTVHNYDDHLLECGGYWYKKRRGNQCGLCGDPVDGPRDHEAGGRYATGILTASYYPGQRTQFKVLMNTNQGGYFQFSICSLQSSSEASTQACFDQHPVPLADGSGFRYYLPENQQGVFTVDVVIPEVTCQACVLQWIYTGNHAWGFDADGNECRGCGPQYELRNCADVAITSGATVQINPVIQNYNRAEINGGSSGGPYLYNPSNSPTSPTFVSPDLNGFNTGLRCVAVGTKRNMRGMDDWCTDNCNKNYCPQATCSCQGSQQAPSGTPTVRVNDPWGDSVKQLPFTTPPRFNGFVTPNVYPPYQTEAESVTSGKRNCVGVGPQNDVPGMSEWCSDNCNDQFCPRDLCSCEGSDGTGQSTSGDQNGEPDLKPADPWGVPQPPTDLDGPIAGPVTPSLQCVAIGTKRGMRGMDEWCTENCNSNYCPRGTCSCQSIGNSPPQSPQSGTEDPWGNAYNQQGETERKSPGALPSVVRNDNINTSHDGQKKCVGVSPRMGHMDEWCTNNCNRNHCPPALCACT